MATLHSNYYVLNDLTSGTRGCSEVREKSHLATFCFDTVQQVKRENLQFQRLSNLRRFLDLYSANHQNSSNHVHSFKCKCKRALN